MSISFKAAAPPSDSEEEELDKGEPLQKRLKSITEYEEQVKPYERFTGGIIISSEAKSNIHSASASLSVAEKKGKQEVEELRRELDLKNTFSNETNRRDEDAEMNKYIEEQIKLRREAAKSRESQREAILSAGQEDNDMSDMFTLPSTETTEKVDEILLHTLAKNYSSTPDEKSEAMLSSQMLNGIPEVDLGLSERIRTIEATEEAKLKLVTGPSTNKRSGLNRFKVPTNFSCNFQQHRHSKYKNDLKSSENKSSSHNINDTVIEPVVAIGEEPREVEFRVPSTGERRPPQRGRASDDYHLQKFKKNSRR